MVSETDKAYAAGILDADGCVTVSRTRYTPRHSWRYAIAAQVFQADQEAVSWLALKFGGSVKAVSMRAKGPNYRQMYKWALHCRKAADFLELILPYLKIKKYRAELGIQLARMNGSRGGWSSRNVGRAVSPEDANVREQVAMKLRGENNAHSMSVASRAVWGTTRVQ